MDVVDVVSMLVDESCLLDCSRIGVFCAICPGLHPGRVGRRVIQAHMRTHSGQGEMEEREAQPHGCKAV